MHGNEVVGRETLIPLISVLCENYGKQPFITRLVNETRIFIMPCMNPDGHEIATEGECVLLQLQLLCIYDSEIKNESSLHYF